MEYFQQPRILMLIILAFVCSLEICYAGEKMTFGEAKDPLDVRKHMCTYTLLMLISISTHFCMYVCMYV